MPTQPQPASASADRILALVTLLAPSHQPARRTSPQASDATPTASVEDDRASPVASTSLPPPAPSALTPSCAAGPEIEYDHDVEVGQSDTPCAASDNNFNEGSEEDRNEDPALILYRVLYDTELRRLWVHTRRPRQHKPLLNENSQSER
ncbi:hypothetical protein ON010_g11659 [Phytophthora cinnamomi]|nr:hypothetical protein ON010_g11659 [Phytophthora cinnamomi]